MPSLDVHVTLIINLNRYRIAALPIPKIENNGRVSSDTFAHDKTSACELHDLKIPSARSTLKIIWTFILRHCVRSTGLDATLIKCAGSPKLTSEYISMQNINHLHSTRKQGLFVSKRQNILPLRQALRRH